MVFKAIQGLSELSFLSITSIQGGSVGQDLQGFGRQSGFKGGYGIFETLVYAAGHASCLETLLSTL